MPYAQKKLNSLGYKITLILDKKELKYGTEAVEQAYQCLILSSDYEFISKVRSIHEVEPFDGVISFTEDGLLKAAECSRELGLPGLQVDAVKNTINKHKLRVCLDKLPECNVPYKLCKNEKDVIDFYKNLESKKLVLKPTSGMGSKGVIIVRNSSEINKAFRYSSNNYKNSVLAEVFVDGEDFSVETFTNNGKHQLIAVTDKYNTGPPNFVGKYHVMPGEIDQEKKDYIFNKLTEVLDVLGVKFGLAHTEIKVINGNVKVIETQLRPGGKFYHLMENGLGIEVFELTVSSMFNLDYKPITGAGAATIFYLGVKKDGIIDEIEGVELVTGNKCVCDVSIRFKKGFCSKKWKDTSDRLGHIVCTGKDPQSSLANAELFANKIRINIK